VGNDDGSGCADLCAAFDGSGRRGAGVAAEVCAGDESDIAGEEGGDVFSIGTAAVLDDRFAIVFTDSVGACEGVVQQINQICQESDASKRRKENRSAGLVGLRKPEAPYRSLLAAQTAARDSEPRPLSETGRPATKT